MQPPTKYELGEGTVRRSVIALAISGGVLGAVAVDVLLAPFRPLGPARHLGAPRDDLFTGLALTSAALFTTLLLARALRLGLQRPVDVPQRTFWSCAGLGWLNCPVSLVAFAALYLPCLGVRSSELGGMLLGTLLTGAVLGFFVALPLGMLYGAASMFSAVRLRRLLSCPSHDASARAGWAVGVTVALAGLFATGVVLLTARSHAVSVPPAAPFMLALAGAATALRAKLRLQDIAQLCERARDGELAGYERVPIASLGPAAEDLLPLSGDLVRPRYALVRVLPATGDGAYRSAPARVPWALV